MKSHLQQLTITMINQAKTHCFGMD